MHDLALGAMTIVILYLGVTLFFKIRQMTSWRPPEKDDPDAKTIRIPRELLELDIDHHTGEKVMPPDQETTLPDGGNSGSK